MPIDYTQTLKEGEEKLPGKNNFEETLVGEFSG